MNATIADLSTMNRPVVSREQWVAERKSAAGARKRADPPQ